MFRPSFALNHILAPSLRTGAFFALCRAVGATGAEIRNDLRGNAIMDGTSPAAVAADAEAAGVRILTINGLQRFNSWTAERAAEAIGLADYAQAVGAGALALVPLNEGTGTEDGVRQRDLAIALKALKPILDDHGIRGFVEPLGFETCSLRLKSEAVAAIGEIDGFGTFGLVHDTFHHHLAGETEFYPAHTGIIHISGVVDPAIPIRGMRDEHRVLVDARDRLGTIEQLRLLSAAGIDVPLSFEPFSPEIQTLSDPAAPLAESIGFIRTAMDRWRQTA